MQGVRWRVGVVALLVASLLTFAGCAATAKQEKPILGSTPQAFAATYGGSAHPGRDVEYDPPNDPHIATLSVQYLGPQNQATVIWLSAKQGSFWPLSVATSVCSTFAPQDAKFLKRTTDIDRLRNLPDGYDDLYYSASLARLMPTLYFPGGSPGQFTIAYEFATDNQPGPFDGCLLATGVWTPSSSQ